MQRERYLGHLEQYSSARHYLGQYCNVALTVTYTVPPTAAAALQPWIYAACANVYACTPPLALSIRDADTNKPYFVRLPGLRLSECVQFADDSEIATDAQLDAYLTRLHNTRLTSSHTSDEPLWRLIVFVKAGEENITSFRATFLYHHSIADGRSGLMFHTRFVDALTRCSAESGEALADTALPAPAAPGPNLEKAVNIPYSWWAAAKAVLWPSGPPKHRWVGHPVSAEAPRCVYKHVTVVNGAKLVPIGRKHEVTLGSLLQTQVARSLARLTPRNFTEFTAGVAIDARRFIPASSGVKADTFGVYVYHQPDSVMRREGLEAEGNFPWDEARRVRDQLNAFMQARGHGTDVKFLGFVRHMVHWAAGRTSGSRSDSFSVSNLGAVPRSAAGAEDGPHITRIVFSQSGGHFGSPFELNCASTPYNSDLELGFDWPAAALDEDLMVNVMQDMKRSLEALIAEEGEE